MARTILPSGEELSVTPSNILRYLNPDGLRQVLRQERLHWSLKTNKDVDYYDHATQFRFAGEMHNAGLYQRMELRTYPDNGANPGYAGVNVDSGVFGLPHNVEKWDQAMSEESVKSVVNRVVLGAMATIEGMEGFGLGVDNQMTPSTSNRMAMLVFDPHDGRIYAMTNDDPSYVNNETRSVDSRIPGRALARIGDIPTRITQLTNDLDVVSDPDYRHTDNNFSNSQRFLLDNMDDRTFVYPEISKDANGNFIKNLRVGLNGILSYAESDGAAQNSQPDLGEEDGEGLFDRGSSAVSSYNKGKNYSGVLHQDGYLPGIFRSVEELEKVDLLGQLQTPLTHADTPGAKRPMNYYGMDGNWSPNWFDSSVAPSFQSQSMNPSNMEVNVPGVEPVPFHSSDPSFSRSKLYQWRYNRIDTEYLQENISIRIVKAGTGYREGDILRWNFGDDSFIYKVTQVGVNGQIQEGVYIAEEDNHYDQDPSTHGVGIEFVNTTGVGHGAKLAIIAKATTVVHTTQIKNNLYAYVDITPTVRSDNSLPWSDTSLPDAQGGKVGVRSTAAGPAYSGINSGRGGPAPNIETSASTLYEHGGNATAGVHVHLFRYVINTENPTWVVRNGVRVYTGKWVDQGPMGVERPCDIKALLFSNPDTNNFNNYYKFSWDLFIDGLNRNPDGIVANNPNAVCVPYIHMDQRDPTPDRRFTEWRMDPETSKLTEVDITRRVIYINAATGVMFVYNTGYKNDPEHGYGHRAPGWIALAGVTSR